MDGPTDNGSQNKQLAQGQYAIPVALLCMIVNLNEMKQGSGPKGDEVL